MKALIGVAFVAFGIALVHKSGWSGFPIFDGVEMSLFAPGMLSGFVGLLILTKPKELSAK